MDNNTHNMKDKEIKRPTAYSGKYLGYNKEKYLLVPEVSPGICKGCDLISSMGCTKELTDYCRQGFIFKRIK